MGKVTIDFIAKDAGSSSWSLILVEEGPWQETESNLRRLQDRLYGCLDAAIDGQVAQLYPDSKGKNIQIKLNGYNLPDHEVRDFFTRFSSEVINIPDYRAALEANEFVASISFDITLEKLQYDG